MKLLKGRNENEKKKMKNDELMERVNIRKG